MAGAMALVGCLVSENPVLDASNGRATPLEKGAYRACEASDGEVDESDCTTLTVSYDASGLYQLWDREADETIWWRFRRIARGAYAMQSRESEDDGYAYYYARQDGDSLRLAFMQCASLPEGLRARLIERGDLSSEDEDFETCAVHTLRGLTKAAKAYHREKALDEEPMEMALAPAPAAE